MSAIIEIHNVEKAEPEMLNKAVERAMLWINSNSRRVDIYVYERTPEDAPLYKTPGWLEYGISIKERPESELAFYIAMIQRSPSHEVEFHS
jgi:hypothetical protein